MHIGSLAETNRMSSEFLVAGGQSKPSSGSVVTEGGKQGAKYPGFNSTQIEVMTYQFKQAMIESQVFRCLMIFADFLVCLGHGSNDVANAISPLMILMNEEDKPYWISFFVGGSGIAFGLLLFG
jgi:phosphate/sulfate permease